MKTLAFKVRSANKYWRAGFRIASFEASESMPKLVTKNSFLFHIGKNDDDTHCLSVYLDAVVVINKTIDAKDGKEIFLTIERDDDNLVKCSVNNSVEYSSKFSPGLFAKAHLAAWGDGNNYEVEFSDIEYKTEDVHQ